MVLAHFEIEILRHRPASIFSSCESCAVFGVGQIVTRGSNRLEELGEVSWENTIDQPESNCTSALFETFIKHILLSQWLRVYLAWLTHTIRSASLVFNTFNPVFVILVLGTFCLIQQTFEGLLELEKRKTFWKVGQITEHSRHIWMRVLTSFGGHVSCFIGDSHSFSVIFSWCSEVNSIAEGETMFDDSIGEKSSGCKYLVVYFWWNFLYFF